MLDTDHLQFASNINQDNEVYIIKRAASTPISAAALVSSHWENKSTATLRAIIFFAQHLLSCRPELRPWVLLAHTCPQPDNGILRYKGLAKLVVADGFAAEQVVAQSIVTSGDGIKLAGLLKPDVTQYAEMARLLRSGWQAHLFYADEETAQAITADFFTTIWLCDRHAPAPQFLEHLAAHDAFAAHPLGWFDDREGGCALLARPHLLAPIFPEARFSVA